MIQNFKRLFLSLLVQPCAIPTLFSACCILLGFIQFSVPWELIALTVLIPTAVWQRVTRRELGQNFILLRSIPLLDGPSHYFVCQRQRKGAAHMSCKALLQSLLQDKYSYDPLLPKGCYRAITHKGIIRILKENEHIELDGLIPLYADTLRPILMKQTGGRCRRCKHRCASWKAKPRQFYLVSFTVP